MPRPATLWIPLTLRIPPQAEPVVRAALDRFYTETNRPLTDPVALGYMLEMLCADFLAGPSCEHPASHLRRPLASREDEGTPTKETTR
jgi:hypothetical protein